MCDLVSTFASGEESRISWQTDPPNPFHLDLSLAKNKVQATSLSLNAVHVSTYFAGLFCASLSITLDANHSVNVSFFCF
jgi:hypothetical protein